VKRALAGRARVIKCQAARAWQRRLAAGWNPDERSTARSAPRPGLGELIFLGGGRVRSSIPPTPHTEPS
jgi:hypothetical protein